MRLWEYTEISAGEVSAAGSTGWEAYGVKHEPTVWDALGSTILVSATTTYLVKRPYADGEYLRAIASA